MTGHIKWRAVATFIAIGFGLAKPAEAQGGDPAATSAANTNVEMKDSLHPGAIELGISGGLALGDVGGAFVNLPVTITFRISGSGSLGGTAYAGAALTRGFFALAEASFLNGRHDFHDLGSGTAVETYTREIVYDAALEYRFSRSKTNSASQQWRITPYIGIGVGTAQSKSDVTVLFAAPGTTSPQAVVNAATQVRFREPAFAPMLVAGAQVFLHHNLGFRLEGRGLYPLGSVRDAIGEVAVGIFVVLH